MNSSPDYYREKLYPFQDGILKIVKELELPFYLTGGTALSRFYYNHRFSDDLDLFVNNDSEYRNYVTCFWEYLEKDSGSMGFSIDYSSTIRADFFTQIILSMDDTVLQIDLVNDIARHYGEKKVMTRSCPIDSWENMLSNKLTALYRFEPKDYVDLLYIYRNETFSWNQIIEEAKTKEAGLDTFMIADMIKTIPLEQFSLIKWTEEVDTGKIKQELSMLADDLLGIK